jgi:hypothetical protein
MDYSVHDAILAGFNKIVFIIRKDIEDDFRDVIGNRIETLCNKIGIEMKYVMQDIQDIPEGVQMPEGRVKPWGTGQAVLACKEVVNEPFVVINADDYYGKTAFREMYNFLKKNDTNEYCMAGFILKNTLSENGGVTRGLCEVDKDGYLTNIVETYNIVKTEDGAEVNWKEVNPKEYLSMNMWGLNPNFIKELDVGFKEFFSNIEGKELTAEYLLPTIIGSLLRENRAKVKVLPTPDKWVGVTYQEDKPAVIQAISDMIEKGEYELNLYSDLK